MPPSTHVFDGGSAKTKAKAKVRHPSGLGRWQVRLKRPGCTSLGQLGKDLSDGFLRVHRTSLVAKSGSESESSAPSIAARDIPWCSVKGIPAL